MGTRAMLENAFARLVCEVEPIELWISQLQRVHNAQTLQVVLETTMGRHAGIERILSGMPKGRVSQIMRQGNGLYQVFVDSQGPSDRAPELRHLQRMRQPGAEQIALMVQK